MSISRRKIVRLCGNVESLNLYNSMLSVVLASADMPPSSQVVVHLGLQTSRASVITASFRGRIQSWVRKAAPKSHSMFSSDVGTIGSCCPRMIGVYKPTTCTMVWESENRMICIELIIFIIGFAFRLQVSHLLFGITDGPCP